MAESYESLRMELGAIHESDINSIVTRQLAAYVSRQLYEEGARHFCRIDSRLVGAPGLSIYLPKQAKMVAGKIGDLAEVSIGGKPVTGDLAETFMVGARAEWGYAASEAKDIDFISGEIDNLRKAIKEYELEMLIAELASGTVNTFTSADAGKLAYADLVKARKENRVDGFGMDYILAHPDQMEDLLKDATLIDTALNVGFSKSVWTTKLGWQVAEFNKLTAATAYCFTKSFATFVEKKPLQTIHYDAGKSGDPRAAKGVWAWEMFDIVAREGNASCSITAC